ncbi:MAG: molybdate ABC transporter substrate-binding protein [Deltaproteobacteria bacterium]|nr:molybdate ABC transporter substrate-binding protein [Deltaproteobacteria bacterium]MBI3755289.1 molybdate ABC transporter substrate-binding protein [Deltaproteobacteria bacterium]
MSLGGKGHGSWVKELVYLVCFIFLLAPCPLSLAPGVFAEPKSLTIAVAADLSFAFTEISGQFEKESDIKIVLSFGSTGMFARQIENGAPFDIFFAANEKYIDELASKGLIIPGTKQLYAQGRLVLAVNKKLVPAGSKQGSGVNIRKPEDLLDPSIKKIAIANPDHAPYGIAAKEAMIKLELWDKLKPKMIYAENIRQAVQFVQTGDASAGIVALSVADVPEITYTIIDSSLHNPINQAVAIIKTTKVERDTRLFIDYVNSPAGRAIMKKYGFGLPQ